MLKTLIFDVDGVLVRSEPFTYQLEQDYGIKHETLQPFFENSFPACLTGNADLKQELATYLQQWGWPKSVEEFLQYWFISEHNIDETLVERIQQLRKQGIPCYIATNQERYRTTYILEQMGFAAAFDGIFSSAHIGYMKSQVAFFAHVLRELSNIQAQNILFWDDSPGNIQAAQQAGLRAELYTNLEDFQHKIDHYLSKDQEL